MENNVNEAVSTAENTGNLEDAVVDTQLPVEQPKGLSLRDALEVAKVAVEDKKANDSERKEPTLSANKEGKGETRAQAPQGGDPASTVPSEEQKYEPPAEYTAEEKRYFSELSRKAQEAQLRLDKSRKTKIEEIKAATREYEHARRLAELLNPYIKATGGKEPAEVALTKALQMWKEFEEGDPRKAAADYLRAKGIEPPKELLQESQVNPVAQEIAPLQSELNLIKQRLAEEDHARASQSLTQAWSAFEQEKNAAGGLKFPDLNNTEAGLQLASNIGSLVSGRTDLSRQFIANVQARIPGASYLDVMAQAYRYLGGRVDETGTPKSQTSQSHLIKSNRAAASVPGRSASSNGNAGVKKYKTYREAAEAAIAQLNSD